MSITAMKQALEALQQTVDNDTALWEQCEAITALRAAIAEAEKCEPAGLFYSNGKSIWYQAHPPYQSGAVPLYTAPQDVDMLLEKIDVLQQNLEMTRAAYIANTHPAPVDQKLVSLVRLQHEALKLHAEQYPHMQKGYTVDALEAFNKWENGK